jgi:hypothetical protein
MNSLSGQPWSRQKLVDVVVEAVVDGVDLAQPTVPACPLPITYASLCEADHPTLTLNVYSHVLPDMGDAAAEAMDATFG